MDARVCMFLLICGHVSTMPQMQATPQTNVTNTKNSIELSCVTGKEDKGFCVKRSFCDYGTPAIDLTLYSKHGYKSVCSKDEVCCPQLSILQHSETNSAADLDDSNFSNEDDDDIF